MSNLVAKANEGSSTDTLAADEIAGVFYPRSKIALGGAGQDDGDVSLTNPMPVNDARFVGNKVWSYKAGTSGTRTASEFEAFSRMIQITAVAPSSSSASFTIGAGETITVPDGSSLTVTPELVLGSQDFVFTGTSSYFIEYVYEPSGGG